MMRFKKTINSITIAFLTLLIFSSINRAITIGDSTVSVDINDKYYWIVTKDTFGAPFTTGDKYNLTVQNINGTGLYLVMDVKLDYYNDTGDIWITPINGIFLIFNETLDYIQYFVGPNAQLGWIFIIPIPLNLSLIGNYINFTTGGNFESMSISNTTLTLVDGTYGSIYKYSYNNDGILTKFTIELTSILAYEMVIESDISDNGGDDGGDDNGNGESDDGGDDGNGIPFGNSYLLITIIGISIVGIVLKRRKINKN